MPAVDDAAEHKRRVSRRIQHAQYLRARSRVRGLPRPLLGLSQRVRPRDLDCHAAGREEEGEGGRHRCVDSGRGRSVHRLHRDVGLGGRQCSPRRRGQGLLARQVPRRLLNRAAGSGAEEAGRRARPVPTPRATGLSRPLQAHLRRARRPAPPPRRRCRLRRRGPHQRRGSARLRGRVPVERGRRGAGRRRLPIERAVRDQRHKRHAAAARRRLERARLSSRRREGGRRRLRPIERCGRGDEPKRPRALHARLPWRSVRQALAPAKRASAQQPRRHRGALHRPQRHVHSPRRRDASGPAGHVERGARRRAQAEVCGLRRARRLRPARRLPRAGSRPAPVPAPSPSRPTPVPVPPPSPSHPTPSRVTPSPRRASSASSECTGST